MRRVILERKRVGLDPRAGDSACQHVFPLSERVQFLKQKKKECLFIQHVVMFLLGFVP